MDNTINFNELWTKQKIAVPNTEDLLLKINKFKKSNLKKLVRTNLLLAATSLFIIFIWVTCQPQMMTTKIGIVLIILAMVIFVMAYNQSFSLFKTSTNTMSNSQYLKDLLAIKAKQKFMHTTMLNLYFALLSIGIGLYMYEYARRMSALGGILTYAITFIWILYSWIYLRPKQIKKQQSKLDEIISKFEMFNEQLEEKA